MMMRSGGNVGRRRQDDDFDDDDASTTNGETMRTPPPPPPPPPREKCGNNKEKKEALRREMRTRLQQHFPKDKTYSTTPAEKKSSFDDEVSRRMAKASRLACDKVVALDAFKNAKTMCVYIAHPKLREVDCSSLIREALRDDGKKVFVPIVDDRNSNVRFLRVRDPVEKDLEKRTMGIMEPTEIDWRTNEKREDLAAAKEKLDLVITPGLAFDKTCKRLGRGGGYYDKFLSQGKGKEAVKVGLAFDAQILREEDGAIPLDPWDVVLDVVVSESHVHHKE